MRPTTSDPAIGPPRCGSCRHRPRLPRLRYRLRLRRHGPHAGRRVRRPGQRRHHLPRAIRLRPNQTRPRSLHRPGRLASQSLPARAATPPSPSKAASTCPIWPGFSGRPPESCVLEPGSSSVPGLRIPAPRRSSASFSLSLPAAKAAWPISALLQNTDPLRRDRLRNGTGGRRQPPRKTHMAICAARFATRLLRDPAIPLPHQPSPPEPHLRPHHLPHLARLRNRSAPIRNTHRKKAAGPAAGLRVRHIRRGVARFHSARAIPAKSSQPLAVSPILFILSKHLLPFAIFATLREAPSSIISFTFPYPMSGFVCLGLYLDTDASLPRRPTNALNILKSRLCRLWNKGK